MHNEPKEIKRSRTCPSCKKRFYADFANQKYCLNPCNSINSRKAPKYRDRKRGFEHHVRMCKCGRSFTPVHRRHKRCKSCITDSFTKYKEINNMPLVNGDMADISLLSKPARLTYIYTRIRAHVEARIKKIEDSGSTVSPMAPFLSIEEEYFENLRLLTLTEKEFFREYAHLTE